MGLFSKPKVPTIDTGALLRIAEENANKQKTIIGGLQGNLSPISTNFENKRNQLSESLMPATENTLGRYGQELSTVGAADTAARNAANVGFREQSFRDVPEIQRAIRESLGGSGTIGNAAALSALSRPVLDANRASRDFTAQNETSRLMAESGRNEKLADTGFNARSNAIQTKLGLDTDTVNYLTSIGREDLVREAESLMGVEDQLGTNRLGIEQARQANEMAKAAAANAGRGNLFSQVGQIGGGIIGGIYGGPMGAAAGSQIGGQLGGMAGGQTSQQQFDPTLLFALGQRNKAAVSRSLGGGRSTPTTANYSSVVG